GRLRLGRAARDRNDDFGLLVAGLAERGRARLAGAVQGLELHAEVLRLRARRDGQENGNAEQDDTESSNHGSTLRWEFGVTRPRTGEPLTKSVTPRASGRFPRQRQAPAPVEGSAPATVSVRVSGARADMRRGRPAR